MKPTRLHYFYAQNWPARIWSHLALSTTTVLNSTGIFFSRDVEILVGAMRGRVLRVAEVWEQRGEVRVELPESAGRREKAAFHFAQVIKVHGAESSSAADRPHSARG